MAESPAPLPDFEKRLNTLVHDYAPRLFAVTQLYGDQQDARIAAWGHAFADHYEVTSTDGASRQRLNTETAVLRHYTWGDTITARIIWVDETVTT